MPFLQKKVNLSIRTKRRRVAEELKNSYAIDLVHDMPSTSSTLMNYNHAIATANSNSNIYNSSSLPIIQHNQNTNYQCSYLNSAHSNLSSNTMILNSSNEHNSLLAEDINSPHVNINIKPTDD